LKAKVSSISAIICLITLVFFCILACDNGSVSDSSAAKSSGLVDVSLTVDKSSASQKSISVDSDYDPANLKFFYRATPQWSQDRPIHGSTNNQFILIPSCSAGSPASLGSFTAGEWIFEVQVKYGSTLVYQGTSAVTSIYANHAAVNVLVNKIIQAASGTVSVTVTAPTVAAEAMTVAWSGTASGSGSATATPLGNGTSEFTYTASGLSSGYYTFTLNHSSTGAGAAVAVDLRAGERAEITGHIENGVWQVGCVTVKVHEITKNFEGCNYQINVNSAAAGDKVSFYIEPFAGNILQGTVNVTWTGGSINPITPDNGLYTFVMPDADVTINAIYSGVDSDIEIPLFKALFKIIHEAHPAATSFGYDSGHATGDYFEIKGVKLWYDSVQNKICWKNDAGTFRFKSGSMANFFKDCSIFTYINLSGIDTSLVTNMSGMFRGCEGLTEIVLDSEKVEDSEDPRYGKFLNFNTANVTDMSYMFCSATVDVEPPSAMSLATLDVSGLDTSNVTNMSHMFYMCWQLSELDVSGFRTSNVTDMSCMFSCYNYGVRECPGHLTEIDMRNWDFTNVTTTAKMFDRQELMNAGFLFPETTNFASLTTMWYMFSQCLALTPDVFSDIVATWTFENHAGYPNSIYGDTSSFFGNYNDNNNSNYTLTDARNYIFRDKMTQGGSAKFKNRETCTTKDGHQLWIGKGNKGRHGKLTTQETVH